MLRILSSRAGRRGDRRVAPREARALAALAVVLVLAAGLSSGAAYAQAPGEDPANDVSIAAQAQPSECWVGNATTFGQKPLPIGPDGTCPNGGKPRITADYLWGFSKDDTEENLWFGTAPNVACTGMAVFIPSLSAAGLERFTPFDSDELTCEFDSSYYAQNSVSPALGNVGDARTGKILEHNVASGQTIDRTPPLTDVNYTNVAGIRAAGGLDGVMFLAGIETDPNGGTQASGTVDMFAYDQKTGAYLGSQRFNDYSNVKNFKVLDGHLYVGMNLTNAEGETSTGVPVVGAVLKWTGDKSDPFRFERVGSLGGQPAYFEVAENHIVATTWVGTGRKEDSAVYISPDLAGHPDGLTAADENGWKKLFDAGQYYPDPVTALNQYGMGAQEYGGYLYFSFSTIGIGSSTLDHLVDYPGLKRDNLYALGLTYLRSEPAASVFRMKNLGKPNQTVELLYGNRDYWNFYPNAGRDGRWKLVPNLLGQRGLFGPGGFGNRWADYAAWGMNVFRGKLYMGGFSTTKALRDIALNPKLGLIAQVLGRPVPAAELNFWRSLLFGNRQTARDAGPVWVFDGVNQPARPLTTTGFNNPMNWGVRGIQTIGDKAIYFGTNNAWNYPVTPQPEPTPVNLPGGQPLERAGWQLLKYAPPNPAPPLPPAPVPDVPTVSVWLQASPAVVRAGDDVDFIAKVRAPSDAVVTDVCITLPDGFAFAPNSGADVDGNEGCFDLQVRPGDSQTVVLHAVAPHSPQVAHATADANGISSAGQTDSRTGKATVVVLRAKKHHPPKPPHHHHHHHHGGH